MRREMASNDGRREEAHNELERVQGRRFWIAVLLPFLFLLTIVIAMIGIALSLRSPVQVAVLSDSMLTVLVLCPLAVLLFPIVILSFALIALVSRLQLRTRSPLRRLEALTATIEGSVEGWLGQVDGRVLDWAVRLAPLRQLLATFDPPDVATQDEGDV